MPVFKNFAEAQNYISQKSAPNTSAHHDSAAAQVVRELHEAERARAENETAAQTEDSAAPQATVGSEQAPQSSIATGNALYDSWRKEYVERQKTDTERNQQIDALQGQLDDALRAAQTAKNAYNRFSNNGANENDPTVQSMKKSQRAAEAKVSGLQRQITALGGKANMELPGAAERTGKALAGGALGAAASNVNALGAAENFGAYLGENSREEDRRVADNPYSGWATDELTEANMRAAPVTEETSGQLGEMREDAAQLFDAADTLQYASGKMTADAKRGALTPEKFLVDVGGQLAQMGGDAVLNLVAPGLGSIALGVRSFGGAAQEARQAGATEGQQFLYGIANASLELATEKMFDGVAGIYGKGKAEHVVEATINKLASTNEGRNTLRYIAGMVGEGSEEFVSDAIQPLLQRAIYDEHALDDYGGDLSQGVYDFLVGAAMGGVGGAIDIANGTYARKNAKLDALRNNSSSATGTAADAEGQAGAATEQERTGANTSPEDAGRGYVADVLDGGKVNNTTAREIARDPYKAKAFTELTGIELDGTTAENVKRVQTAARERAYAAAESERLAQEAQTMAEVDEQSSQEMQSVKNSGYGSYIRGVLRDGVSYGEAQEIARNPAYRQTWESMSGKTLPANEKSAIKMIQQTRRANPDMSLAQPEPATPFQARTATETATAARGQNNASDAALAQGGINTTPAGRTDGTTQNGEFNSVSDARTAKTGAEYLAEAVTGRNAAPEQTQQNIDNNSTSDRAAGGESLELVKKIKGSIADVSDIHPVASVETAAIERAPGNNLKEKARTMFERIKGTVERDGFGEIEINNRSMKDDFGHGNGYAKTAIIPAIPAVLQKGKLIERAENWKGRGYTGYVFSAPVTMDGGTVYVGAVVLETSKNRFYLHEVVDSEGRIIKINSEGTPNPTGLTSVDATGGIPSQNTELSSVESVLSSNSLSENRETVNSNLQTRGDGAVRERGFSENIRTDANRESSLRDAVEASPDMYRQLGNKQTIERAQAVYDKGLAEARSEVEQALGAAKAGQKLKPETVPLAKMVADELTRQGDISGARRIISDIGLELTSAGQLSQAAKLLRSESAATKADFIGALVDRMNAGLTDKQKQTNAKAGRGDADGSIKVSDELIKRYATAPDAEAQNAVLDEIQTQIAEQIPATFTEKWNALRYLNMLGNLKTQERNIIGNMAMAAMTTAKRHTAQALGDLAANLATNGEYEKNTSFAYNPKLYAEARADANARMDEIRGDVKYSDSRRIAEKGIQDRRRIFKPRIIEGARKLTNWAMEAGDDIFLRFNYADAMAGWMQAHGIKSMSDMTDAQLESARAFATKEAQEATFHDSNRVSDYVSQFGRTPKTLPLVKTLSEGALPFRKTPANVVVRAVEYSPVGLAETIYTGIQAKKGNATAADVINSAAKSATGTALAAAGYFLAAAGRARATGDDSKDKKEKYFEQMRGEMDYSIKIGDTNVSLSQFAPTAVPFFMGVKLFEGMDGRVTLDDALMILGCITDPLLEMSMFSGVDDILNNIADYSGDTDAIPALVSQVMLSYFTQGLTNTLTGQLAQAQEENRKTIYTDPDSFLDAKTQKTLSKAAAKWGIQYHRTDYIDAWGRKQSNGSTAERYINALINPTYTSNDRSTEVDDELQRIYAENRGVDDFPNVLPQSLSRNKEYAPGERMTVEEYEQYSIARGQKSLELVSSFMKSEEYKDLTDLQRATVISSLYQFAADRAMKDIKTAHDVEYTGNWDMTGQLKDPANYLAAKTAATDALRANGTLDADQGITRSRKGLQYLTQHGLSAGNTDKLADYYLTDKQGNVYEVLRRGGKSPKAALEAFDDFDANDNGSVSQDELFEYLTGAKGRTLTEPQKAAIWANTITGKTDYSTYLAKHR